MLYDCIKRCLLVECAVFQQPISLFRARVMSTSNESLFEAFLNQHHEVAWAEVVAALLPSIHEVDKSATRIWFAFYPLSLHRALEEAEDAVQLAKKLLLSGKYQLKDQIDSSHTFLYGHRYWPEIKRAVVEAGSGRPPGSLDLAVQILEVARAGAAEIHVQESLLVGITAVAFMTLRQVGMAAFKATPGEVLLDARVLAKTPEQILQTRAKDDPQGVLGFLKGFAREYTITFNENDESAKFKLINSQELATAAANDKRDYRSRDPRCVDGQGPVPIECRSAACGTCWVGILGGAEKLSEVARLEAVKIKEFGYIDTDEPKPLIRLACQAQAFGAVSIVIPSWNGFYGKSLRSRKNTGEETQTGSAR